MNEPEADIAQLATTVNELSAQLTRVMSDLDDLAQAVLPDPLDLHDVPAPDPVTPPPAFTTLDDWVSGYFKAVFTRSVGGDIRWCNNWQDHPEAWTRLEALWRSWETLRLDPNLGIAIWLTNYLDPQMAALMGRSGTFASCTPDRHLSSGSRAVDGDSLG